MMMAYVVLNPLTSVVQEGPIKGGRANEEKRHLSLIQQGLGIRLRWAVATSFVLPVRVWLVPFMTNQNTHMT